MKNNHKKTIAWIVLWLSLVFCPAAVWAVDGAFPSTGGSKDPMAVADPLAPWNESMFIINDLLYTAVLNPLATGYRAVTPTFVRTGIKNFFHNLAAPARMVACLLQGKGRAAGKEAARFIVNTTAGGLGFYDHMKDVPEFNPPEEDLGQSLATWGIGSGFYIVWPVLGPSTLRDTVGMIGDRFLDPVSYVDPWEDAAAISTVNRINDLSFRLGDYEAFIEAAIDPYESMKDAYMQNRVKDIRE